MPRWKLEGEEQAEVAEFGRAVQELGNIGIAGETAEKTLDNRYQK